jgi:hypothetical protein
MFHTQIDKLNQLKIKQMKEELQDNFGQESIKFSQIRDFGKLLGAPFTFYRQEMKMLTRALLIYAGPFLLISLVLLGIFMQQIFTNFASRSDIWVDAFAYIGLFLFFIMLAFSMAGTVVNCYVVLYEERGRNNFTLDDVWTMTKQNYFRILGSQLLIFFLVLIGLVFCYIPGIYLQVALSFVYIAMLKEKISFSEAFGRSFQIIKGEWWFTFGLILVLGMILGFISYIFIIPPYVAGIASALTNSFGLTTKILMIVFVALYFVFYLFMFAVQTILNDFIYFSLVEKKESPGLLNRIQTINTDENIQKTPTTETTNETPENLKNRFLSDDNYNRFDNK